MLWLRVTTGLMMLIGHGLPKIEKFAKLKASWYVPDFFPFYFMSPQVSLIATIGAEVVASIQIASGEGERASKWGKWGVSVG